MTRVDPALSRYSEAIDTSAVFDRTERKRLRTVLRRLQFLEHKSREEEDRTNLYTEWEIEALEYLLTKVGYLVIADD